MSELLHDALPELLGRIRVIAVLGAHPDPARPSHYVPEYLFSQGVRVLPVNPAYAGRTLWGQLVRATLAELDEPVDLVVVFRRPELLPQHLDDVRAMHPRPKVVWLQQGIRNDALALALGDAGIDVVQDRCMLADHRAFGVARVSTSGS